MGYLEVCQIRSLDVLQLRLREALDLLLAAAQRGVLKDMGHAGVVWRVGLEADGEDIVAVVAGDVQVLGAGLVVLQMQRRQLELRHMLGAQQGEAAELLAGLGILRELRHGPASPLGRIAKHPFGTRSCSGAARKVQHTRQSSLTMTDKLLLPGAWVVEFEAAETLSHRYDP